jgi:hypothetical protein
MSKQRLEQSFPDFSCRLGVVRAAAIPAGTNRDVAVSARVRKLTAAKRIRGLPRRAGTSLRRPGVENAFLNK